jgi:hypothetical protein
MFGLGRTLKEATNGSLSRLGLGNSVGKRRNNMTNSRTNARITGVLFILGTVPMLVALALWGKPILSPDYLSLMAANSGQAR